MKAICEAPIPDSRKASRWPIPEDLARVVDKALARDRAKRFADAGEMLTALQRADLKRWRTLAFGDERERTPEEVERDERRRDDWFYRRGGRRDIAFRFESSRWLRLSAQRRMPDRVVCAVRGVIMEGALVHHEEYRADVALWINERDVRPSSARRLLGVGFRLEDSRYRWRGGGPWTPLSGTQRPKT